MSVADRVRHVVEPLVLGAGLEIYDVLDGGTVVQVMVQRPGEAVGVDDLAALSRAVSAALDDADPIAGHYTLEVTSPGLERPLRTPSHFRAAVGAQVKVRTQPGVEGDRRVDGTVVAADADGVTIALGDAVAPTGERHLGYDQIERARTVFSWGPSPASHRRARTS